MYQSLLVALNRHHSTHMTLALRSPWTTRQRPKSGLIFIAQACSAAREEDPNNEQRTEQEHMIWKTQTASSTGLLLVNLDFQRFRHISLDIQIVHQVERISNVVY
jgi:hypothetical protein